MTHNLDSDIRFSIIPEWILDSTLSDKAIRLYGIIARYADNETLQAFPSRETLAKRARCHVKSVDRAVHELINAGALFKEQRKNGGEWQSNVYTLRRIPIRRGRDTDVATLGTPVSPPRDTDVSLTRTTELEPKNDIVKIKAGEYTLSDEAIETLASKHPLIDVRAEVEAFNDHHRAKGSTFKDWDAAFRTWCRNSSKWSKGAVIQKPAAKVPGHRDWVEAEHDRGDHYACRGGEFGHPADWKFGA